MIIIAGLVGSLFGVFLMWMLSGHDQCNKDIAWYKDFVAVEEKRQYLVKLI